MKIQFEAYVVQIGNKYSIARGEKWQNIICRLDDTQYYELRCRPELFSMITSIEAAQKYVIECETRTSNFTHPYTKKVQFNIQLIANKIQQHESIIQRQTRKPSHLRNKDLELAIPWSRSNVKA